MASSPLFDSHSHINAEQFNADREDVVVRMREAGLVGALVVGCDYGEETGVLKLTSAHPGFLHGAWALHPEFEDRRESSVEEIIEICSRPGMVAVGETGLDYHWCKGDLTWQKDRFVRHIEAAHALKLPIVVHAREAESDALDILTAHRAGDVGFVLHCYGGDRDTAFRAVDAGGLVSFTGTVTFKNALTLQAIAKELPLESIMVETDCPYMAPVPLRGKRNEPAYVRHVADKIAALKEIDPALVARTTTETARRFFHLDSSCA